MRTDIHPVTLITLSLLLVLATTARADDSVTIRIYNDGVDNMDVTVYDINAQPPGAVLADRRINGFAWISVAVAAGDAGNGHILWAARSGGASSHRCGLQEVRELANDDSVEVFADSKCVRSVR